MTSRKLDDLVRMVRNEGKTVKEVYDLELLEDHKGEPLAMNRKDIGGGTLAPVRLTEDLWKQLAHYTGLKLSEARRRELLGQGEFNSWADVARIFIKAL